ncbi:hypothetical protein QJQ45_008545 [Haematococcus lacustris]|nr:hypothetical protein QJQ45_008545 [Haematococcus lacustris]
MFNIEVSIEDPFKCDMQQEEEAADVSQWRSGTCKQLVVFFGNAAMGTLVGHRCRAAGLPQVVERPNSGKPTDRLPGQVVKWMSCAPAEPAKLRAGEAPKRPVELCWWPHRSAARALSKEYPGLGFKKLID